MVAAGDPTDSSDITTIEDYTIRRPLVRLLQQAAQSIASGTSTALTFGSGSEEIDTHGFHDETTNNTRITPTVAGYYRFTASYCTTSAATTMTAYSIVISKNGTVLSPMVRVHPGAQVGSREVVTTTIAQANGTSDWFDARGEQSSGGAQNTAASAPLQSTFECEFLRPL